jgi:carbon storage regulator
MLILTQKVGETIILNCDIEITLTDIQGCDAMIGIDAPKEVKISYDGMSDNITPNYG